MNWIFARLKEPSTHAALAAIAAASIPLFGQYGVIAMAVFAVLGFGVSETKAMIAFIVAAGLGLSLSACSGTTTPVNVADVFKQGCAAVSYADGAFQAAAPALIASGKLAAADVDKEKAIFTSVSATCASPPADAATAGLALLGQASAIYLMLSPKA